MRPRACGTARPGLREPESPSWAWARAVPTRTSADWSSPPSQTLTGESGWRATRIVDKAPRVVVDGVTAEEADRVRRALEDLGAIVEVS